MRGAGRHDGVGLSSGMLVSVLLCVLLLRVLAGICSIDIIIRNKEYSMLDLIIRNKEYSMLDLIIRNERVLENCIYYVSSIDYDFLIFRNLWFLRVFYRTYGRNTARASPSP